MSTFEAFDEVFKSFHLGELVKEIDLLTEIALTTDNGYYDASEERDRLFFFKRTLVKCLEAAEVLAEKNFNRIKRESVVFLDEDDR